MNNPRRISLAATFLMFVVVAAVVAGARVSGQSAAPVIGSPTAGRQDPAYDPSGRQALLVRPPFLFAEVHPTAEELARIERLPRHTVGPFQERTYGFAFVDVYFDRHAAPEDERSDIAADSTLRLTLRMRTRQGAPRFWRLESSDQRDSADHLIMGALTINDEPDENERVMPATGDPSVPLLEVRYAAAFLGGNTGGEFVRHLLLDLRRRTPRALAVLDDADVGGGGVCTAFDMMFGTRREIGCQWVDVHGDFRCAETLHRYDTDWTERRGSRFFLLDSGKTLASPGRGAHTLSAFVEDAVRTGKTETATVERYGAATIIGTSSFASATVVLVGTPLLTDELSEFFGVRFHTAVLRAGAQAMVEELIPRSSLEATAPAEMRLPDAPPGAVQAPSDDFVPDGIPLSFRARVVFEAASHKVLQVTATEGAGRGVYLVGLEYKEGRLTADALLVATEAPTYNGCNRWVLPMTAVAIGIGTNPFTASLDIEPAHLEGRDEKSDDWVVEVDARCPSKGHVSWRSGTGFELRQQPVACGRPRAPRRVNIDEEGRLTASVSRGIQRPAR